MRNNGAPLARIVHLLVCPYPSGAAVRTLACAIALVLLPFSVIAQPKDLAEAKRAYEAARGRPEQPAALKAVAALGGNEALKFLLEELRKDQHGRPEGANKVGLLPTRVRNALLEALARFSDEAGIKTLVESATAQDSAKDPMLALNQLDMFLPLAAMRTEGADKALRTALAHKSNAYIKCAAMEALRRAKRDDFTDEVLAVVSEKNKAWLQEGLIVTLNALDYLRDTAPKSSAKKVVESLLALVAWVESQRKLELDRRILFFAQRALEALTGEKASLRSVAFWKWWLLQNNAAGKAAPRPPANPERATGNAFDVELVGHRIVFLIDLSSSMNEALPDAVKRDERFAKLASVLDLARIELARSLRQLPNDCKFAIVTYSQEARCITDGWVAANETTRETWASRALELKTESTTNIHGALVAGLRVTDKGVDSRHPAVDVDAMATGADAFVLLTDGWASWCDDSDEYNVSDPRGGTGKVGNGKFILGEEIALDILRLDAFRKVIINTVGIGNHDRELLRTLAASTGGTYVNWGGK
jgi:von Willebrand factor type A domain